MIHADTGAALRLCDLPPDVADAADALHLAIQRHKRDGWTKINVDEMLAVLCLLIETTNESLTK